MPELTSQHYKIGITSSHYVPDYKIKNPLKGDASGPERKQDEFGRCMWSCEHNRKKEEKKKNTPTMSQSDI